MANGFAHAQGAKQYKGEQLKARRAALAGTTRGDFAAAPRPGAGSLNETQRVGDHPGWGFLGSSNLQIKGREKWENKASDRE
jgi:hypothetical protein